MTGLYIATLRMPDGREAHAYAYLPTEGVRESFLQEAGKAGLECELRPAKASSLKTV